MNIQELHWLARFQFNDGSTHTEKISTADLLVSVTTCLSHASIEAAMMNFFKLPMMPLTVKFIHSKNQQ